MQSIKKKGFTLIELLVVIAIIGILAAMVLVALSSARNKAKDSRIKSALGQLRTEGEVYYDSNTNTYTGFCASAGNVATLTTEISDNGGSLTCNEVLDGSGFAVSSALNGGATTVCHDSTGKIGASAAVGGVCP